MKNKRHLVYWGLALLLTLAVFGFFYQKQQGGFGNKEPISATSFKLNTIITVTIFDNQDEELLRDAIALCDKYEAIFSRTKEKSELYRLNHGLLEKDGDACIVSRDMADIVAEGLRYGELSHGAFDIAIEPVSSLWDFTSKEKKVPSKEQLSAALPLCHYEDVRLEDNRISFRKEGMGLELGAIAKGYIADRIKDFLVSKGVKSATIDLGGNVLCIGNSPKGKPFRIGIQKPFADRNETVAVAEVTGKSVVSSGIYERYFEKDGVFYHHILNPETGMPCDNSLLSVTIISDKSVDGDALSTACFALGLEEGMALINSREDAHAIFITDDNELHFSEGFEEAVPLTLTE